MIKKMISAILFFSFILSVVYTSSAHPTNQQGIYINASPSICYWGFLGEPPANFAHLNLYPSSTNVTLRIGYQTGIPQSYKSWIQTGVNSWLGSNFSNLSVSFVDSAPYDVIFTYGSHSTETWAGQAYVSTTTTTNPDDNTVTTYTTPLKHLTKCSIRLNTYWINGYSDDYKRIATAAHEFGHVLGLVDLPTTTTYQYLLMYGANYGRQTNTPSIGDFLGARVATGLHGVPGVSDHVFSNGYCQICSAQQYK
jgi:hypothetical protein